MEVEQKKILKPLVLALRHLLEGRYDEHGAWQGGDLEARMNSLGVWWDRDPIPADKVTYQSREDQHAREVIDAYLTLREEAGIERRAAIEEFVRETAYTWANRLLILRCMEARDLIDPQVVLTKEVYGGRSQAHNRLAQRHPELCSGADGGLFAMLEEAFTQHARHLPLLFDPKAPSVALRPSVAALKKCIGLLSGTEVLSGNGPATDEVFAAHDALGWAYQYWNTEEKDRVFEKVRTKKAKIQGADIIPATQLYTEPYMVKFLVQNSLGATWMGMYPDSDIAETWEYYVKDADRAPVRKKNVENITFLDPACGSGHFLIEAFDLFFRMYEAEGKYTDEETICKKILTRNLYGIDIDERAVQIARAALWMKAAERVFDFSGTPKNIIATNIRLPKGKDHLKEFLAKHPEDAPLQPALETIFEGLAHADELGSLLQIEEPVERELRHLRERLGGQTTLSAGGLTGQTSFTGPMTDENWGAWKDGVIERLADHFTGEAEAADLVNAFFSQNAGKGVRLFELLSKRYDVVAANPPFMGSAGMASTLRKYIETNYNSGKRDLFAAFIIRCNSLSKLGGKAAMVTQQSWMFLKSYINLRISGSDNQKVKKEETFRGLLVTSTIETLAHLGPSAFEEISGEVVNVALVTFTKVVPTPTHKITAIRLIGQKDPVSKNKILSCINNYPLNIWKSFVSKPIQRQFQEIPNAALSYWLSEKSLEILIGNPRLEDLLNPLNGLQTGCNDRFIHFFWETTGVPNWLPYCKGGTYTRWAGIGWYTIRWETDNPLVKLQEGSIIPNEQTYFLPGYVFNQLSQGCISPRLKQDCELFDHKAGGIFFKDLTNPYPVAAICSSRAFNHFLRGISPSLAVETGYLRQVPIPQKLHHKDRLNKLEMKIISLKETINEKEVTERIYGINYQNINSRILLDLLRTESKILFLEGEIENIVFSEYMLNSNDIKEVLGELGTPVAYYPLIEGYDDIPFSNEEILDLNADTMSNYKALKRLSVSCEILENICFDLKEVYETGPKQMDEQKPVSANANFVPIPVDSYIEELSNQLKIHPISVYWLLKEGIEQEGWRCIPEEQRITADRFTVMILRMLGHRWPKQIEAGEPVPDWADADGIIPLTSGSGEATLLERVRARNTEEFPGGSGSAIEREFEELMDKSLEEWLHLEFFKHHTKQFKKRPIAWQVQSGRFTKKKQPAFACMVYYHKLDEDTLYKIKNQYVGPLRQKYETEMRGIEGIPAGSRSETQEKRYRELGDLIAELKVFGETLTEVMENGFASKELDKIAKKEPLDAWCSIDGAKPAPVDLDAFLRQERSFIPDINDGVRVNIAPLQKAGLLAGDVIAKKDLEKAISDRAEWRADERRWCREGKLPRCGWWPQEEEP